MISMILLYGASTSYHSFDISEKGESAFEETGSYDDFCNDRRFLYTGLPDRIASRWGCGCWQSYGGLAIVGMIFKLLWVTCPKWVSSVIYIGMGWVYSGYAAASCRIIIWSVHVASGRRFILYSGRRDLCDEVSCIP